VTVFRQTATGDFAGHVVAQGNRQGLSIRGSLATTHANELADLCVGKPSERCTMTKRELIDAIMELNRSAQAEFLAGFEEAQLRDYLRQLKELIRERGRGAVAAVTATAS
jgi:hypothetical protein